MHVELSTSYILPLTAFNEKLGCAKESANGLLTDAFSFVGVTTLLNKAQELSTPTFDNSCVFDRHPNIPYWAIVLKPLSTHKSGYDAVRTPGLFSI
jgi:hypothetical protein